MVLSDEDKFLMIRRLREGGHVKRCHVLPHNDPGYTDGKHSFDALSMLLVLHPDPSIRLIKYMLWHDTAERWVGDLPASVKFASHELSSAYNRVEGRVFSDLLPVVPCDLTTEEADWVRALDALEFFMWCNDQMNFGNIHVYEAMRNIVEYLDSIPWFPEPCGVLYEQLKRTGLPRLPERFDR